MGRALFYGAGVQSPTLVAEMKECTKRRPIYHVKAAVGNPGHGT